jgi:hypothetical protein
LKPFPFVLVSKSQISYSKYPICLKYQISCSKYGCFPSYFDRETMESGNRKPPPLKKGKPASGGRRLRADEVDEAVSRDSHQKMLKRLSLKGQCFPYPEQWVVKEPLMKGKHRHELRYPLMHASAFYEHDHIVNSVFPAIRKVFLEQNFVQHDTYQTLMCVLGLDPHFRVNWVFVGKDRAGQDYGRADFDHVIGLVRYLLKVAFEDPRTAADNVVSVSFTAEKVDRDFTFIRFVVGEDDFVNVKVEFLAYRDVGVTFFPSAKFWENRFGGFDAFSARAHASCEPAHPPPESPPSPWSARGFSRGTIAARSIYAQAAHNARLRQQRDRIFARLAAQRQRPSPSPSPPPPPAGAISEPELALPASAAST